MASLRLLERRGWRCSQPVHDRPAGIWTVLSNNILFQYNESHHNDSSSYGIDGDGFDLDGGTTNSTVQFNYSHDNGGAGYLDWQYSGASSHYGNTFQYNISQNDSLVTLKPSFYVDVPGVSTGHAEDQLLGNIVSTSGARAPGSQFSANLDNDLTYSNNTVVGPIGAPTINDPSQLTQKLDSYYRSWCLSQQPVCTWLK